MPNHVPCGIELPQVFFDGSYRHGAYPYVRNQGRDAWLRQSMAPRADHR